MFGNINWNDADNVQQQIGQTAFTDFAVQKNQTLFGKLRNTPFSLSWSHYLILMWIQNEDEHSFYEIVSAKGQWIVSAKGQWDVRTLQLYDYNPANMLDGIKESLIWTRNQRGTI